jgi:hypothetical protein
MFYDAFWNAEIHEATCQRLKHLYLFLFWAEQLAAQIQ